MMSLLVTRDSICCTFEEVLQDDNNVFRYRSYLVLKGLHPGVGIQLVPQQADHFKRQLEWLIIGSGMFLKT